MISLGLRYTTGSFSKILEGIIMKMKKLILALALVSLTSLSYAESDAPLTDQQLEIVSQAVGLLSTSDISGIVELVHQHPNLAAAIYEALAKANPQGAPALASQLATATPEQAGAIVVAMISGVSGADNEANLSLAIVNTVKSAVPEQSEEINEQIANAVLHLFNSSVQHFDRFNDTPATINSAQQLANNIQLAATQRIISQTVASGLINKIVHQSHGGVTPPVIPSIPVSRS